MNGTAQQLQQELEQAKADLAFALAQGDGYAEDDAAARIATLEKQLADARWTGA
jgi:hypothetical protein